MTPVMNRTCKLPMCLIPSTTYCYYYSVALRIPAARQSLDPSCLVPRALFSPWPVQDMFLLTMAHGRALGRIQLMKRQAAIALYLCVCVPGSS